MKKLFSFFILALSLCLCSCDKDDVAINEYHADIFEALHGETNEYYFIESTYEDAFSYAGLVDGHGINSMKSASRDKVLQACAAAEETIKDANYEFKGYYVFGVKENGQCIYFKTFGTKYKPDGRN